MKTTASAAVLAITLGAAPFATALTVGDTVGADAEQIRATLEAEGYVISEIEVDDDEIEVEATRDGVELEIEIDPATAQIIEIELENDDD